MVLGSTVSHGHVTPLLGAPASSKMGVMRYRSTRLLWCLNESGICKALGQWLPGAAPHSVVRTRETWSRLDFVEQFPRQPQLRVPALGALSSRQAHEVLGESLTFHSEMGHGSQRQPGSEFQAAKLGKEF